MRDATVASRLERATAALEIAIGRLERLTGSLSEGKPLDPFPGSTSQPPVDEAAQKMADAYIERRREELMEHEMAEIEDG